MPSQSEAKNTVVLCHCECELQRETLIDTMVNDFFTLHYITVNLFIFELIYLIESANQTRCH